MSLYIQQALKGVVFLALFLSAGTAFAHAPVLTVAPVQPLAYETFPQIQVVTGTIKHAQIQDVRDLTLFINGVQENIVTVPYVMGDTDPNVFSLPWSIEEEGNYTIQVKARHGVAGQTGSSTISHVVVTHIVIDTEECPTGTVGTYPLCQEIVVPCDYPYEGNKPNCSLPPCPSGTTGTYPLCEVIVVACSYPYVGNQPNCSLPPCPYGTVGTFPECVTPPPEVCPTGYTGIYPYCVLPETQVCPLGYTGVYPLCVPPVVLECPAAPSYASAYLKLLGLKPGGSGFKNAIASVAHHMDPAKVFDGINACSSEYKDAVEGYIDDLVALRLL
jgi:hypothetical protein